MVALLDFTAGFLTGIFVGIGAAVFYIRWKMQRQIANIEDQMGAMMDLSDELSGMMEPGVEEHGETEEKEE